MERIHNLLKRQIRKQFGNIAPENPEWESFLELVNNAYWEFDADRKMLERALELSSQELMESNSQLRAILEAFPDVFVLLNSEGFIIDLKAGSTTDLYIPSEQLLGKHIDELQPYIINSSFNLTFSQAVKQVLEAGITTSLEYSIMRNRQKQHFEARLLPIPEDHIFVIIRNITERQLMEDQLRYISMHDALTGLYNRTYFKSEITRLDTQPLRPIGLIICDIDGLKLVNDTLGHEAGDTLLIKAASTIRDSLRYSDSVSRIGGDEFAVILYDCTKQGLEGVIKRIKESINVANSNDPAIPLSISMGCAIRNNFSKTMEEIFTEADDNMYKEKLFHQHSSRNNLIRTMMSALGERDFITQGHADRLQKLVCIMADALKLPQHQVADLKLLAQFHDIGKVGISDSILFKKGPLNSRERTDIERHPEIGYRIACSSPLLMPISDWILKHHEWWDGKGYPFGLAGDEIPMECRILALADAYDAMTSERPYRQAIPPEEAIEEIKQKAGIQFDPELTRLFVAEMEKIL